MGRNEIINQLVTRTGSKREECEQFCDTLVDIITDAMLDDEKILWKGFMSIDVTERGQRKARNPKTNEVTTFPPVKSIRCRMSKAIKDMLNNK